MVLLSNTRNLRATCYNGSLLSSQLDQLTKTSDQLAIRSTCLEQVHFHLHTVQITVTLLSTKIALGE